MSTPIVETRNLCVTIDGHRILSGIDITVRAGEFLGVLGHNGSGKSTLIRTLMGLQRFSGEAKLFGTPLASFRDKHRIGYLSQDNDHTTGVPSTVLEVVLSGTLARHRWFGWPSKAERREAQDLIERVGLGSHAKRPISELSGGQRQRAHIARALVGSPDLLVMDEPTVGVDTESLMILADILRAELDRGTSVIMVTHELGPIRNLVSRSITLEAGAICETCDDVTDLHAASISAHYEEIHAETHTEEHNHHAAEHEVRPVVSEGPLQ